MAAVPLHPSGGILARRSFYGTSVVMDPALDVLWFLPLSSLAFPAPFNPI